MKVIAGVLIGAALGYFAHGKPSPVPLPLPPNSSLLIRGHHRTVAVQDLPAGSDVILVSTDRETMVVMECDDFERGGIARYSGLVRPGEPSHFGMGLMRKCEFAAGDPLALITIRRAP